MNYEEAEGRVRRGVLTPTVTETPASGIPGIRGLPATHGRFTAVDCHFSDPIQEV